jgi:hypothetical protein
LIKMIYNLKNLMNQKSWHSLELQLNEMMKMKIHLIELSSIVNWIQIK